MKNNRAIINIIYERVKCGCMMLLYLFRILLYFIYMPFETKWRNLFILLFIQQEEIWQWLLKTGKNKEENHDPRAGIGIGQTG